MKMMIASGQSTVYTTIAALDGLEIMSCRQQEHRISLTVSSLGGEVTESLKDKTEHRKERRRRSYGSVEDQGIETSGNDQLSPSAMRALTLALAVLFMLASGFGVALTSLRRQIDKSAHSRDEGEGGGIFSSDGKFWLVNPINVTTNGNKPTLTKTEECTGDMQRPVLAGSDLVEYWRLEEGSKPTKGYREINSTYNGYLFLFASAANQHAFEVSQPSLISKRQGCLGDIALLSVAPPPALRYEDEDFFISD